MSTEERLKQSFISKYQRKIQNQSTTEAWNRYEKEIKPTESGPMAATNPQQKFYEDFETPEYETPKEKEYDPHRVFAMPRATFRGLIIGLSCLIGATCFVILRPQPIVKHNISKYKIYCLIFQKFRVKTCYKCYINL